MTHIPLDGDWQLTYFPQGKHSVAHPDDLAAIGAKAVPARVPGNVELDLHRAGLLPDPFYADNIRRLRPMESCEWWYTREFELGPKGLGNPSGLLGWDLVCAGLDTLATVWINGVEVGRAANMLIERRFDVSGALHPGVNRIAVRLESATARAGPGTDGA